MSASVLADCGWPQILETNSSSYHQTGTYLKIQMQTSVSFRYRLILNLNPPYFILPMIAVIQTTRALISISSRFHSRCLKKKASWSSIILSWPNPLSLASCEIFVAKVVCFTLWVILLVRVPRIGVVENAEVVRCACWSLNWFPWFDLLEARCLWAELVVAGLSLTCSFDNIYSIIILH